MPGAPLIPGHRGLAATPTPSSSIHRHPRYATTASTHVSGAIGPVVTCLVDGEPIEAVIPASLTLNLNRLLALAGGSEIGSLTEEEVERQHPECAPETMPDLYWLHRQLVTVDVTLVSEPENMFQGGQCPRGNLYSLDRFRGACQAYRW